MTWWHGAPDGLDGWGSVRKRPSLTGRGGGNPVPYQHSRSLLQNSPSPPSQGTLLSLLHVGWQMQTFQHFEAGVGSRGGAGGDTASGVCSQLWDSSAPPPSQAPQNGADRCPHKITPVGWGWVGLIGCEWGMEAGATELGGNPHPAPTLFTTSDARSDCREAVSHVFRMQWGGGDNIGTDTQTHPV